MLYFRMPDVLRIAAVFITILILLRLKWNVGYVLLIASGLLSLLYLMPLPKIGATVIAALTDTVTIKLLLALTLIRVLEMVLRERQVMASMMEASRTILRSRKAVIISMPMLIGLLPSLGGAYFSAPMVEEATRGLKMPPEEKSFINYWYRHPWEYVLPLYPGILLASAITGIPLRGLILSNSVYAVLIFATGFLFSMRDVKGRSLVGSQVSKEGKLQGAGSQGSDKDWKPLLSFLPLGVILVLVIALHVELHYSLAIVIACLFAFYRYGLREIFKTLRYGFAKEVLVLISGVMLFKFMLDDSGAVVHLSSYFKEKELSLFPVLIMLPFASGILTGITVGFVGSTFPLIMSLAGGAHLNQITLAFVSGFLGVLLSPVHLCLVLTREYFKADAWGIYQRMLPACAIIMAAAFGVYLFL